MKAHGVNTEPLVAIDRLNKPEKRRVMQANMVMKGEPLKHLIKHFCPKSMSENTSEEKMFRKEILIKLPLVS